MTNSEKYFSYDGDDDSSISLNWNRQYNSLAISSNDNMQLQPLICRPNRLWYRVKLYRFTRKTNCRYILLTAFILVMLLLLYIFISDHVITSNKKKQNLQSVFHCSNKEIFIPHLHSPRDNDSKPLSKLQTDIKILLFTETQHSKLGKSIAEMLVANRMKYKMQVLGKSLPILTNLSRGKYGVIIFENYERYLSMDVWNRELLDKYLIAYRVGIIGFMPQHEEPRVMAKLHKFPLFVASQISLINITLNGSNPVLRLTRGGQTANGVSLLNDTTEFIPNHPTYSPIEWGHSLLPQYGRHKHILTVLDEGKYDGIRRILFGFGLSFWLHRLLLLDGLSYFSEGRLSSSLDRFVMIDVDDIFVGPKGARLTPDDVEALVAAQERFHTEIPEFKFNLGFSGKYFKKGSDIENLGDELLLKYANKFGWFGHMYGHSQPHKTGSLDQLVKLMEKNKEFAMQHGIATDSGYSISPHHSGVYPVHEPLYEAWKKVWNVRVTSSEEYPHLRPARLRRGFIHKHIMVLPRQTCGLYTHTSAMEDYPGGKEMLDLSIRGGELFQTVINNPISVFMTHQNNYANDRLAIYTFEGLITFLKCWTNVKLLSASPLQLGEKYFQFFPNEMDPVWGNPCLDHRHLAIWSENKTCDRLPKFLVIGPQKTGTTALYSFLSMHPAIFSNSPSPETFEEIQFFNGRNYYKGVDWYMTFFPVSKNTSIQYLFEKSATYFDGEMVPKRVKALLPDAKLIMIIIPPEKRAYSWYHHMRAHDDPTSLSYTFIQVINATSKSPRTLRDLKNKCLNPGMYAKNVERWLDFFPASSLSIIDGEQLRSDPVFVMTELQKFLSIEPFFNYTEHLRFDKRKGFFCQVTEKDKTKCLGRGKGRQYPPMDTFEEKLLKDFYKKHNIDLEKLLVRLNYQVPSWLYHELSG